MSKTIVIPHPILEIKYIGWVEKIVLSLIRQEQVSKGYCDLRDWEIGSELQIHTVQVNRYIKKLSELGLLERERQGARRKMRVRV